MPKTMEASRIEILKQEIAKRSKCNRYVVSGNAHDGKFKFTLFNVSCSKGFFTGTNDYTAKFTINMIMWDTITSIKAVDWDTITKEEILTKIF